MLDLFSGLGGASEAFVQAGWTVIRIENNPKLSYVPFTRALNVRDWRTWALDLPKIDLIWASPPCREFSRGYQGPKGKAERAGVQYEPDMSLVEATMDIIEYLDPSYWIIENVGGAIPDFEPVLGKYSQRIESFFLWTSESVPFIPMPYGFTHKKSLQDTWSTDPLRANKKAMIPFEVSFALMSTLRDQNTLRDYA